MPITFLHGKNSGLLQQFFCLSKTDQGSQPATLTPGELNSMPARDTVAGISDMLLQGWGDILRVFSAVPRHWQDVAFCELLAEGGWRVSAIMRDGDIQWVRVTATVKRQLCLRDPFDGKGTQLSGPKVNAANDLLITDLCPGASIEISLNGQYVGFDDCAMLAR